MGLQSGKISRGVGVVWDKVFTICAGSGVEGRDGTNSAKRGHGGRFGGFETLHMPYHLL